MGNICFCICSWKMMAFSYLSDGRATVERDGNGWVGSHMCTLRQDNYSLEQCNIIFMDSVITKY